MMILPRLSGPLARSPALLLAGHSPAHQFVRPLSLPPLREVLIEAGEEDRDGSGHPNVFNVRLNRPDRLNTFTPSFFGEIRTAFEFLADEPKCRAIVLSANGPMFSAGLDLKEGAKDLLAVAQAQQLDPARRARALGRLIRQCQQSVSSLRLCAKPVVAAVHGHCIGAGINLVASADVRFASRDAKFSIREVDIGIAADLGVLQLIHFLVGNDSWARELALTGRDAPAQEALQFGLVSRLLDSPADCLKAARELAAQIAAKSPVAVQGTKLAMNRAREEGPQRALDWMADWNAAQLQTADIPANLKAKMAKEVPQFQDL